MVVDSVVKRVVMDRVATVVDRLVVAAPGMFGPFQLSAHPFESRLT